MGAELYLRLSLKDRHRLKEHWLFQQDSQVVAPQLSFVDHEIGFWVDWRGTRLDFAYSGGGYDLAGGWALSVALELCKHYTVEKAGWDSVGYCESMEEFLRCQPFRHEIERVHYYLPNIAEVEAARLKEAQRAYAIGAVEIFT